MPHQPLRTEAPVVGTLLMAFSSRRCQMETYPNKPIQLIPRFALGGRDDRTARILDHKFGEKIIQSITLEPLPLKLQELGATAQFKCEPWGKLINTINLRTQ